MTLNPDLIWTLVSFILTLLVFSYLLGITRVSLRHSHSGGGLCRILCCFNHLSGVDPRLIVPLVQGSLLSLIPLFLSGLLLTKLSPRLSRLGNLSMAYLVGAGAAIAIGGAVLGTLFTQVKGAVNNLPALSATNYQNWWLLLEGGFILLGTIASLVYFNFSAKEKEGKGVKRSPVSAFFAAIGQFFIAITLGAVFAGVMTSAITALIERSHFLIQTISSLIR
jgi:hypothetical protein